MITLKNYSINGYDPSWGSHIPVLIDVFNHSKGPVLEIGIGPFSTPLLHTLCIDKKRKLVSYENDPNYFDMHKSFIDELHNITLISDWNNAEIENIHWGMVLIDQKPAERRVVDIKRLANKADYILIHDSEPQSKGLYHYDLIYPLFKYRFDYILRPNYPQTTVLSNFKDLTNLNLWHE